MPMPYYRNTNYSPIYALLGMALICVMTIAGPVFKPVMTNLAGGTVLREFKDTFQDVQHPAGTEHLSLRTKMGEFTGGVKGCDFFVGEVRRFPGNKEIILATYSTQTTTSNPLQVVFLESGQLPPQVSDSLPELLNDLAGWELPPGAGQQPMYMVYLLVVDNEGDLRLDCR
ncbi:MAG: hypothetical protein A2Y53_00985 [Chloroflexi bacterium RBG_16_47_49]|nr:MAG: hypothetical protein A2Y53_00985 [Chloroflexi bacterium RBG_16_47_49]